MLQRIQNNLVSKNYSDYMKNRLFIFLSNMDHSLFDRDDPNFQIPLFGLFQTDNLVADFILSDARLIGAITFLATSIVKSALVYRLDLIIERIDTDYLADVIAMSAFEASKIVTFMKVMMIMVDTPNISDHDLYLGWGIAYSHVTTVYCSEMYKVMEVVLEMIHTDLDRMEDGLPTIMPFKEFDDGAELANKLIDWVQEESSLLWIDSEPTMLFECDWLLNVLNVGHLDIGTLTGMALSISQHSISLLDSMLAFELYRIEWA